jgi:hypothetical protein
MVDFGCDFDSSFELISPGGHFKTVNGVDNARQAVINRLTTIPGDLDVLDYEDYGNYSYLYLGLTDIELAKSLIKLATQEALMREPVVKDIKDVVVEYSQQTCIVDIDLVFVQDTDEEDDIENIRVDLKNVEEEL